MLQIMSSPFRYNKKQRKKYRKHAKAEIKAADKFATEGSNPQSVAALRTLADLNTKMSLAKRHKKKSKNSN
jgi:hypothetical protein